MDYENDIYRKPVWDEQLAVEDEFNKAMMQVQTQPKVQEDDGGWGDLMKQFGGSVGNGQVERQSLAGTQGATLYNTNAVKQGGFGRYKGMLMGKFG